MSSAVASAWLAGALAAAAIVEVATALHADRSRRAARGAGLGRSPARGRGRAAAVALGVLALLARAGRRAGLPVPRAGDLAARLDAAGVAATIGPSDVAAIKLGAALAAALLALPLVLTAPGRLGLALAVAAPAGALLGPDVWLARRARRRAGALALEVADVLDLLRIAIAAGLPPVRAVGEVGRRRGGLLGAELSAAAARIELGVGHAESYATLAARCPVASVAALCTALTRAERHGTSLVGVLRALALDARAERARALELRAARAAPKIQLVVALLLVPAVLLLVAGALVRALG